MVLLNMTAGAATTPLAFTVDVNTNSTLIVEKGEFEVQITKPGIYEVAGTVTMSSTGETNYGMAVYANGSVYAEPFIDSGLTTLETVTIPVYAVIEIVQANKSGYATISFEPIGTPTIVSGSIAIKRIP